VHANQVFAAIGATVRMLNITMHRALAEQRAVEAASSAA
jgi:D-citramalate synthase